MKQNHPSLFLKIYVIALCTLFCAGCLPGAKPPYLVEQNTLEYMSPVMDNITVLNDTIKVNRFSAAQAFNNISMAYKPAPYKIAVYNGSRWRVNPGDMVTDFLLRDLRNSGIFKGAFSYRDDESVRFVLEGGVDEFLEVDEQNTGKAVISLTIALIDTNEKEITKRLVFQKKYRAEEPLTEQSPAALAQGMSTSMKRVSEQLLKDIYSSLQKSGK